MSKVGIYINDSSQPFTEQIICGVKTVETRTHLQLKRWLRQEVFIIRTGKGKPMVVGRCKLRRIIQWFTEDAFRADYSLHRISKGSPFDWVEGKIKVGYELSDVERVEPYELPKGGRRYGRIAYEWED